MGSTTFCLLKAAFFNDNFEVGSSGSELEVYLDSGNGSEDASTLLPEPGFPMELGTTWGYLWNRLEVVFGRQLGS